MPLTIPTIDDRKYQDLLNEALARIPVHNPEWTNFNKSDPGVTLIEIFAFLTENLLYRANQIPERNRYKFLSLLGISLQPAASARGLVTFANERGPLETITLNADLEVRAGQVPFRTENGLDVLPIEAYAYYKRRIIQPSETQKNDYRQLYASYAKNGGIIEPELYETQPLSSRATSAVNLGETIDNSLWLALVLRATDQPYSNKIEEVRQAIGGKTLSLGIVPVLTAETRHLRPVGSVTSDTATLLQFFIPTGELSSDIPPDRVPKYKLLDARPSTDVLIEPGIVQITLPSAVQLKLWESLDPLESGVGDFPPALDDATLNERVITWLRITSTAALQASLLWAGINTAFVFQRAHVVNEQLPDGTGEPDQSAFLANKPIIPNSVRITVSENGNSEPWYEINDILSAGPEVPTPDLRLSPGTASIENSHVKVFTVNLESGEIRFGDGFHGKRPPNGARLRADYDYGSGQAGNVGAESINASPVLPAGLKVRNPIRTWGGADAESVSVGEKQIPRYLQHRDRLVSVEDFYSIVLRTPGLHIGRVEVIPAYNPELNSNEPGDAPGAVTLMIIPQYDPLQPDAPMPDRLFLDIICKYLDSRRLVTTEIFLRGPVYKQIWISFGINVASMASVATVREAVKKALVDFLSPLPPNPIDMLDTTANSSATTIYPELKNGWPLRTPVVSRELLAVASRVPGILSINGILLAEGIKESEGQINMAGLELPRIMGISVSVGDPVDLAQLRGTYLETTTPETRRVSVPIVPEECR